MPKTIAFIGTPGSGSSSSIEWLSRHFGAPGGVVREEALIWTEVEHPRAGTLRIQAMPSGMRFTDGPLADADAIVYAIDTRSSRSIDVQVDWQTYFRETLDLAKLIVGREAEADPPIVLQYTHRDAPNARAIEAVDTELGIQRILVAGTFRMPNPAAASFPRRYETSPATGEGLLEAFESAANAAVDGPFVIPEESADFAMAMLDKQLGDAIAGALGASPALARQAVRGDEDAKDAMLAASKEQFVASLVSDAGILDSLVGRVMAKAGVSLLAPDAMRCSSCGAADLLMEAPWLVRAGIRPPRVGSAVSVDFEAASRGGHEYWALEERTADAPCTVLELATCGCGTTAWCSITVHEGLLASIFPADLTPSLGRAHAARASALREEAARRSGQHSERLAREQTLAILRGVL